MILGWSPFKEFHSMQNLGCHQPKGKLLKSYQISKQLARMVLGLPSNKVIQIILIG